MKQSEAVRLMTKLAAFFPGTPEATVVAFASEIQRYDVADIEHAIEEVLDTMDRFPSLKQLRSCLPYRQPPHFADLMAYYERRDVEGSSEPPPWAGSDFHTWLNDQTVIAAKEPE